MSTLKVDTIQTAAGVKVYPSKAWLNFNGTGTVAIRDDGNVSSLTDNGTGTYTANFTSAFSSANYAMGGATDNTNLSTGRVNSVSFDVTSAPATGSCRMKTGYGGSNYSYGAYIDLAMNSAIFSN